MSWKKKSSSDSELNSAPGRRLPVGEKRRFRPGNSRSSAAAAMKDAVEDLQSRMRGASDAAEEKKSDSLPAEVTDSKTEEELPSNVPFGNVDEYQVDTDDVSLLSPDVLYMTRKKTGIPWWSLFLAAGVACAFRRYRAAALGLGVFASLQYAFRWLQRHLMEKRVSKPETKMPFKDFLMTVRQRMAFVPQADPIFPWRSLLSRVGNAIFGGVRVEMSYHVVCRSVVRCNPDARVTAVNDVKSVARPYLIEGTILRAEDGTELDRIISIPDITKYVSTRIRDLDIMETRKHINNICMRLNQVPVPCGLFDEIYRGNCQDTFLRQCFNYAREPPACILKAAGGSPPPGVASAIEWMTLVSPLWLPLITVLGFAYTRLLARK